MSLDAMKQALDALESNPDATVDRGDGHWDFKLDLAITALRAAIEQAQDPETELETYKRLYELRGKALERPCSNCGHQPAKIKAMAQPEQEPVAWQVMVEDEAMKEFPIKDMAHDWCAKKKLSGSPSAYWIRPLYTAPRQWQGLTDEEIKIIWRDIDGSEGMLMRFARAIEAKLKEKNNG